jgi:hypothetical protein
MSPKMKSRPSRISNCVGSLPSFTRYAAPFEQKPPYCGSKRAGAAAKARRWSSFAK